MSKTKKNKGDRLGTLIVISVIILLTCVIYGLLTYKIENRGTFGDMFGALTALFSGLAFAGIIYTILLQRQELKLQRRELRLSRLEFKTQNSTLKKQRFENTFFNLLNYHSKIVGSSYFHESTRQEGQGGFTLAYQILLGHSRNIFPEFKRRNGIEESKTTSGLEKIMAERYINETIGHLFKGISNNYPLYIQSLYQLMKFLDSSSLLDSIDERQFYSDMIKDQMTDHEKAVIMYYCILPSEEAKRIGTYILKYRVIDDLKSEIFLTPLDKIIFNQWGHG